MPTTGIPVAQAFLAVAIFLLLAVKFRLLTTVNINWDEFRFLARIHELEQGRLRTAFQTFYTRLFTWLPALSGDEADQVVMGRTVAFVLRLLSSACIFVIGRRLFGATGALFAVLASLGFSHVMRHGESFRADPIIASLFLVGAAVLVFAPPKRSTAFVMASALTVGLAALVSIKTVFYLPTLAVILVMVAPLGTRSVASSRILVFGAVSGLQYLGLLAAHIATIPDATLEATGAVAGGVARRVFFSAPVHESLAQSVTQDWAFWVLLSAGGAFALAEAVWGSEERRWKALVVLSLLLPTATLLFYRNAFAYYYVTIVPPASLACGLAAARVQGWLSRWPLAAQLSVIAMGVPAVVTGWKAERRLGLEDTMAPQRAVITAVKQMFPQPVPYLDRCSMVAGYPSAGPFMTTYLLSAYRDVGTPRMQEVVYQHQPHFVLANVEGLDLGGHWESMSASPYRLLREDFEFLQARYVHHWGPIWVAGASVSLEPGAGRQFDLPVSGPYTVESNGEVVLDGILLGPGAVVNLVAGQHQLRSEGPHQVVLLRLGDHLPRPTTEAPDGPLFLGLAFDTRLTTGPTKQASHIGVGER